VSESVKSFFLGWHVKVHVEVEVQCVALHLLAVAVGACSKLRFQQPLESVKVPFTSNQPTTRTKAANMRKKAIDLGLERTVNVLHCISV
jgi:hypothetical protein